MSNLEKINAIIAQYQPIIYLILAGAGCFILPVEKRTEAALLVIGAALTRVKGVK